VRNDTPWQSPANTGLCNIAEVITQRAMETPTQVAMYFPIKVHWPFWHHFYLSKKPLGTSAYLDVPKISYQALSFGELESRSNHIAAGLLDFGIAPGARCVLMVKPSPEFFLLMFALFKAGIVPVLVDPGIDRTALHSCLAHAAPSAFIGIALAHLGRKKYGWAKASIRKNILVSTRPWLAGLLADGNLQAIEAKGRALPFLARPTDPESLAAILFTSGSTGVPKGVEYRHRHFLAQIEMLRDAFQIKPGGVNMPTFPPFALFDPALGNTSIIPMMDATKPAHADPRLLISAIEQFGVDSMFGSPALLRNLATYCQRSDITLPSLKTVMSAGAPVPPELVALAQKMLPADANIYTPFGATEALPVSLISGQELLGAVKLLSETGAGICVGRVLPGNVVRIVQITDAAIESIERASDCTATEVGEIIVQGPSITDHYFMAPEKNALAKIADGRQVWHRMGDVGYFDANGLLWYCGRKSHRVQSKHGTLFTEQVEGIFNADARICRTALVGVGAAPAQTPVLIIQFWQDRTWPAPRKILEDFRQRASKYTYTKQIEHFVFYPGSFPVDIRHNAKIGREKLTDWANANFAHFQQSGFIQ
jgi:olefin beta-lactone synthetase